MRTCWTILAAALLAGSALPAAGADGEPWMCNYKGYTEDGAYHYIAVKPFEGEATMWRQLNSSDFAKALYADLAPGKRFAGETSCAQRPREFTESWFKKILAGKGTFNSRYNTTLAEWRDGRLVELPWPESAD